MPAAINNMTLYTGSEMMTGKAVLMEGGRIQAIVDERSLPAGIPVYDCGSACLAPGFIDLQVYGGGGYLFSQNPSLEVLHAMTQSILASGTTGFLVTLATNSLEVFKEAIHVVKSFQHESVLGIHLEGPYINPLRRGAHIQHFIRRPEVKEVLELLEWADGHLKMMTVAPEVCSEEVLNVLINHHVTLSAGHSNATYKEAAAGFERGIGAVTHLFNAMPPFHHRETGMVGAVVHNENVCASIIADGIHVDYKAVAIAKKILNERLFLITDAVEENHQGAYIHVRHKDRYTLPDGTLSGSNLTLMQAVENCVRQVNIPLEEALRMSSTYPAQVINDKERGRILPGYKADMVVFDRAFQVQNVFKNGVPVQGFATIR